MKENNVYTVWDRLIKGNLFLTLLIRFNIGKTSNEKWGVQSCEF
jgi:hypothetical protein